ncbi:hypothetical protein J1N35_024726 [Gossypium stocksii]|uniref:Uncharacterized protein n=1 Tax=Gossypium stocksii TaxID=47602 RepID=A0A9D3V684_9ROSI|nr:hypothetical protein J1N35_024726 [Gossypium stocksii]
MGVVATTMSTSPSTERSLYVLIDDKGPSREEKPLFSIKKHSGVNGINKSENPDNDGGVKEAALGGCGASSS